MTFLGYAYFRSVTGSLFALSASATACVSVGAVLTAIPFSRFVLNPVFTTAPFSYVISHCAHIWQMPGPSAEKMVSVGAKRKKGISRSM